ncbi:unnamed protein product [Pleuronectes platessa]|uniref:Myb/SANT-like DNA-binding domain-containing protein n=1 Tax=Pleuronectes platessa TaxID=8262 RepID=A0A9N7US36_PLEPL|nr:unnamed protein product [Pleuronectes platessa]
MPNRYPFSPKKSNTAAAARARERAWQEIAEQVNANNPSCPKRTWQQMKMKYKNIVQTANRKKAEARKTGGGPPPAALTEAEEMALSQQSMRPVAEGIPGGSSSDPPTPQDRSAFIRVTDGVITLLEPDALTNLHAIEDDGETLSAAFEREEERPIEDEIEFNERPSTSSSTSQLTSLPVKELYKIYLGKQINKADLEMDHIRQKMQKDALEIQILEHKLKVARGRGKRGALIHIRIHVHRHSDVLHPKEKQQRGAPEHAEASVSDREDGKPGHRLGLQLQLDVSSYNAFVIWREINPNWLPGKRKKGSISPTRRRLPPCGGYAEGGRRLLPLPFRSPSAAARRPLDHDNDDEARPKRPASSLALVAAAPYVCMLISGGLCERANSRGKHGKHKD